MKEYSQLLKWLLINSLFIFCLIGFWYFGLIQSMLSSDKSYISFIIIVVYFFTSFHALFKIFNISTVIKHVYKIKSEIDDSNEDIFSISTLKKLFFLEDNQNDLKFYFQEYISNIIIKSQKQSKNNFDQQILLQLFADKLQKQLKIGLLISDLMLKLGLLGTIVGFILMLAPISNIDAYDVTTLKTALSSMSGGMAIALFTTLAGLVGGILLRTQYFLLDEANEELFSNIAQIAETSIIPSLTKSK
jgi:biopolymer transport protein ExbB/TolQ